MPIDEPSGSHVITKVDAHARRPRLSIDLEEDESVVMADFQPKSDEGSDLTQPNNEDKDYDVEAVEVRMPQEKSSMKSSLKVEVGFCVGVI